MTAMTRTWGRLTLAGKVIFTVLPILAVLTAGLIVVIVLFGRGILDFLATNLWLVRFVVAATAVLLMSVPTAFLSLFMAVEVVCPMNLPVEPDPGRPFWPL